MISFVFILGLVYFAWVHYWILLIAWFLVFGIIFYKMGDSDDN